jgi:hypothetical protein
MSLVSINYPEFGGIFDSHGNLPSCAFHTRSLKLEANFCLIFQGRKKVNCKHSSSLKLVAADSSERLVSPEQSNRRYIPETLILTYILSR